MIVVKGLSLRKCQILFPFSVLTLSVLSPSEVLSIETYERTEAIACQGWYSLPVEIWCWNTPRADKCLYTWAAHLIAFCSENRKWITTLSFLLLLACSHTLREGERERERIALYLSMNASCPIVMFLLCTHSLFLSNEHTERWKWEYDLPFTTGRTQCSRKWRCSQSKRNS